MSPTSFAIESRERGSALVIAIRGELDLHTAPQLEESLSPVLQDGNRPLAIDLSACEFIDSTGIALIIRAWRQLGGESNGTANGSFALCGVSDQVQRLFDLTGIESMIPMHASLEDALAELNG
jgi:anti-sigma B factor antagonist